MLITRRRKKAVVFPSQKRSISLTILTVQSIPEKYRTHCEKQNMDLFSSLWKNEQSQRLTNEGEYSQIKAGSNFNSNSN